MGLKQDILNARLTSLRESGAPEPENDALEKQIEMEVEALVKFLTGVEFRITKLAANVVLEDFKIPPQKGDIQSAVQVAAGITTQGFSPGTTTGVGTLTGVQEGILTKDIDVAKTDGETGNLQSTGYVYIGKDPDSQDGFDVEDLQGQREFTTVKLVRDDIEELL